MRVKAKKKVAYRNTKGSLVVLQRGQVAEIPKEVFERNPGWFDPVPTKKEAQTAQAQAGDAQTTQAEGG